MTALALLGVVSAGPLVEFLIDVLLAAVIFFVLFWGLEQLKGVFGEVFYTIARVVLIVAVVITAIVLISHARGALMSIVS